MVLNRLVYPPNGQGEHSLHGGWSADIWTESAVVEFNQLSQERLIELVSSESGKERREHMIWQVLPPKILGWSRARK